MRTIWILALVVACATPVTLQADAGRKDRRADKTPDDADAIPEVMDSEAVMAMHRKLDLVDELREAVIAGDLSAAKDKGGTLYRLPPVKTAPPRWVPWLVQIQGSASRVEDAWDLDTAARTTAEIARVCSSCHRAEGRGPTFEAVPELPESGEGIQPHMKHHKAAVDLMWEGLIAGDDARYRIGAQALARAELDPEDAAPELDATVHRLAAYGARVQGVAARADTLGAMLATCARCHDAERPEAP